MVLDVYQWTLRARKFENFFFFSIYTEGDVHTIIIPGNFLAKCRAYFSIERIEENICMTHPAIDDSVKSFHSNHRNEFTWFAVPRSSDGCKCLLVNVGVFYF